MNVGYVSGSRYKLKIDGAESFANKVLLPVRIAFGRRVQVVPGHNPRNWAAPTFNTKKESSLKIVSSVAFCVLLLPAMPLLLGLGSLVNALSSTYKMRQHARHGRAYLPTMIFKTIPQKPKTTEPTAASRHQQLVQHLQQTLQPLPPANLAGTRTVPAQPAGPGLGLQRRPNLGKLSIAPRPVIQPTLPKPPKVKPSKPVKIKLPKNPTNTSNVSTHNSSSLTSNINGRVEEKQVINGRVIKHTINGVSQI